MIAYNDAMLPSAEIIVPTISHFNEQYTAKPHKTTNNKMR